MLIYQSECTSSRMIPRQPLNWNSLCAPSSRDYIANQKERFVPLSANPFRELETSEEQGEANHEGKGERPPEWMELVRTFLGLV